MPLTVTRTFTVLTYIEYRDLILESIPDARLTTPKQLIYGMNLVASLQKNAAVEAKANGEWYNRRRLLLSARARLSIARHLERITKAQEVAA